MKGLSTKQAMAIAFKKAAKICPDKANQIYKKKRKMVKANKPKPPAPPPDGPSPAVHRTPPTTTKAHVYENYDYAPGSGIKFRGTMKQMKRAAHEMGIRKTR